VVCPFTAVPEHPLASQERGLGGHCTTIAVLVDSVMELLLTVDGVDDVNMVVSEAVLESGGVLVLSDEDDIVEDVELCTATMTDAGKLKKGMGPGVAYNAGHSSSPRLMRPPTALVLLYASSDLFSSRLI